MCGIYAIICTPTQEFYIGGTKSSFELRFDRHRRSLRVGAGPRLLQAIYDQHGEAALLFKPLKACLPADVDRREREALARFQPSLNIYQRTDVARAQAAGLDRSTISWRRKQGLSDAEIYAAGRKRKRYEVRGEMLSVPEIATKYGLTEQIVYSRISQGARGVQLVRPKGAHT